MSERPYLVKLVRSGIGRFLAGDGRVKYRRMTHAQHVERLRAKLMEEAVEYLLDPSLRELGDLLTALHALAVVDLGITWEQVELEYERKRVERGDFEEGVGMFVLTYDDTGTPDGR